MSMLTFFISFQDLPILNTYSIRSTPFFLSGSCHFDRVLNDEIGVEFQIFVIFFNRGRILQFGAHSRY
jgi:hypothetical protein